MKPHPWLAAPLFSAALAAVASAASAEPAARTAWFREAKFGLFIHWGLYAIPAGEWRGQAVPSLGEWIMYNARIPVADYAALARQFNPVGFNADEWVLLAQDAGMKYIAITSKHHDGFALFASQASAYNVVDATPFRRDVVRELADACHRHGLRFGLYYSQSQDWHHPGGGIAQDRSWDPAQAGDHDLYLRTIAEPQVRELLGRYGPISLIWFDTPLHMTEARTRPFAQAVRTLQPDCLINSRLMLRSADVRGKILSADQLALVAAAGCDYLSRGDNEIPNQVVPGLWETPATINDTWGYKQDDHHWKPPADLVFKLVDIVSKGGNYLLNVGPDATGRIPQPSQQALRAVGRWLRVNGEAIYGAGPSPFGHEFGGSVPADIAAIPPATPPAKTTFVVPRQWRCTTKPGRLYLHVFEWPPAGKLHLDGATATPTRAYLLADARRRPLPVALDGGRLTIDLPADPPGELARVVCLEMESSTP